MSGTTYGEDGTTIVLRACGEHNRRVDYALYLLSSGPDGDVLTRWLNERIDERGTQW
jgi:hypothetical protein